MFTPEMRMRTHTIFCFKVNSTQVIWKNCDSILKWIFQPTSSTFLKKIHENCQEYKGSVSTNCIYLSGGFPEVHKHFCESQWLWWWLVICNVWFLFALKKITICNFFATNSQVSTVQVVEYFFEVIHLICHVKKIVFLLYWYR